MDNLKENKSRSCLEIIKIKPARIVASITGIQVIRALWKIWDATDDKRSGSINDVIIPTIYTSCIFSIMLVITSVIATWSVYRLRVHTLNVCWWVFYMMTIFSFLNGCTNLSIISLGKDDYISGCIVENVIVHREGCASDSGESVGSEFSNFISCEQILPPATFNNCKQFWDNSVIWSAIACMMDLLINLGFSYALYRCRVQYHADDRNNSSQHSSAGNQIHPGGHHQTPPPSYKHENSDSADANEFQVVGLK